MRGGGWGAWWEFTWLWWWGEVEESGRALLDTPPFAKSAKGRAPGVVAARRRTNTGVLHCVQDDEI